MAEKLRAELEKIDREIARLESQLSKARDYDAMKKLQDNIERLRFKKDRRLIPKLKVAEEKEKQSKIKELKSHLIEKVDELLKCWIRLVRAREVLKSLDAGMREIGREVNETVYILRHLGVTSASSPLVTSITEYEASARSFLYNPTITRKDLEKMRDGVKQWKQGLQH